jgi:hypothetical protein
MTTASSQPSNAAERLTRRVTGAVLAALVQALLVAALLLWAVPLPRSRVEKENVFHLMPVAPPAPQVRIIGASTAPTRKPVALAPAQAATSAIAPPTGLAAFGQSLFGCTPQNYASLTPDQRARCNKPGEGLAHNDLPDLMHGQTHVKQNARWANAMAHKQTLPMLPGGLLFPLVALGAVLDGSIAEPNSAFRDPEQWPAERDPGQFMPRRLDEQDRINDAWNHQYAKPAADCAPGTPPGATGDKAAAANSPRPAPSSDPGSATSPAHPDSHAAAVRCARR